MVLTEYVDAFANPISSLLAYPVYSQNAWPWCQSVMGDDAEVTFATM